MSARRRAGATGRGPGGRAPYADERRRAIVARLRADDRVDAAAIAAELDVTTETVRRDLVLLEAQGLLRRVHGGAVPVGALSFEPAVSARLHLTEEKTRIARAALKQLPQDGAVLLDAGSTTARLAALFPVGRRLTVYTNTLPIALSLVDHPQLTVWTLGGRVRPLTLAEVDHLAARALAGINVDVAFLGATAISVARGLTTPDPSEAAVKQLMLASARRRIVLADHTKVGEVSLCKHADLSDIDLLITDAGIAAGDLEALRATGLEVEVA